MDIFYKPPSSRPDECENLEDNYMRCLLQKAVKDKVFVNKCVMDSILWFHLECPKEAHAFDNDDILRGKFRDFFGFAYAHKMSMEGMRPHLEQTKLEYDTNAGPDDTFYKNQVNPEGGNFKEMYKHLDPDRNTELYEDSADLWAEQNAEKGGPFLKPMPPRG